MLSKIISSLEKKNSLFIISVSFFPILLWFGLFGSSVLFEPYVWDDLHVFREYTGKELIEVWYQNWFGNGRDDFETPAYRPLAIWLYHLAYILFEESVVLFRLFVIFLMFLLVCVVNRTFLELNFNKKVIIIFSFLIVFSKIFATLIAWFTIFPLIVCYIFCFLSIIFFLRFNDNKKIIFYFLSLLFAFISIMIREELYILPAVIFFIYFIKFKFTLKNFVSIIFKTIPFSLIVIVHLILRKVFVPDAAQFSFKNYSLYFAEKTIGFGDLIKVLKSSFFPMGYPSFNNFDFIQYTFSVFWFFLIIFGIGFYFYKTKFFKIKSITCNLLIIAIFSSLSHIAIARSFGIFLPSVFIIILISFLILKLERLGKDSFIGKFNWSIIIARLIILVGVFGGAYRSYLHLESMSQFSVHIVQYDSQYIYVWGNSSIPDVRKKTKNEHLNNLNIFQYSPNLLDILDSSERIKLTKFSPTSF